jgi:hypothetical protein
MGELGMKNDDLEIWAVLGGGLLVIFLAVCVKIAFWVAVVWAIVKLVQHFAG